VNYCAGVGAARGGLCAEGFEDCLSCGDLGAAGHHDGDELSELGVDVEAKFGDLIFDSLIGGDLMLLALVDRFEVGKDYIGEQASNGFERFFHEEILSVKLKERLITNSGALVMCGED